MIGTRRIRAKSRAKNPEKIAPAVDIDAARDRARRILESQPKIEKVEIVRRVLGSNGRVTVFEESVIEEVTRDR
jgi:transcription termination factor Rho